MIGNKVLLDSNVIIEIENKEYDPSQYGTKNRTISPEEINRQTHDDVIVGEQNG